MPLSDEQLYQRLVSLGLMPLAAENIITIARALGDRLPTAADAADDAETDISPAVIANDRLAFMYMTMSGPRPLRPFTRLLEARPRKP